MKASIELLRQRIVELQADKLSLKERTTLSFFENLTDNIAVWASRGSRDNYEIVFWNQGAENIWLRRGRGIRHKLAELLMCDEQRENANRCDKICRSVLSSNMIATDINAKGAASIIITNTFRIDDFERLVQYFQAEIGVDVSDLEEIRDLEPARGQPAPRSS